MIVYLNGQYLPLERAAISPDDRGFLLGDGVYEVIRAYAGRLFYPEPHLKRLENNVRSIRLPMEDVHSLGEVAARLLALNRLTSDDALVYVQITRGAAQRSHAFPPPDTPPTVYVATWPFSAKTDQAVHGIACVTLPDIRWSRCDIKSVALLANVLASQRAVDAGAAEAILVRDGVALEGARSNLFGVFSGEVRTAAAGNLILPGVTRDLVLDLCESLGLPVREAPILEERLREADELFLTSTSQEITPVVRLDGRPVGDGARGPVTRRLQRAYRDLVLRASARDLFSEAELR